MNRQKKNKDFLSSENNQVKVMLVACKNKNWTIGMLGHTKYNK
jgi:hypothetical protein